MPLRYIRVPQPGGMSRGNHRHREGRDPAATAALHRVERAHGADRCCGVLADVLRAACSPDARTTAAHPRSRDRVHWMAGAVLGASGVRGEWPTPMASATRPYRHRLWRATRHRGTDNGSLAISSAAAWRAGRRAAVCCLRRHAGVRELLRCGHPVPAATRRAQETNDRRRDHAAGGRGGPESVSAGTPAVLQPCFSFGRRRCCWLPCTTGDTIAVCIRCMSPVLWRLHFACGASRSR